MNVIAAFGEVMLRLGPPEKRRLAQSLPGTLEATFGGSEANVCASLAMLGTPCRFLTALPDNPPARAFAAQLRGLGCDLSCVLYTDSGRMGVYYVEHGSNMRGAGVWYDRENSVISTLGPEAYDMASMLEGVAHLHFSDITCALTEKAFRTVITLAQTAKRKGIRISLDINNRKKLWNWKPGTEKQTLARECLEELTPYADWIIGNREDISGLFGFEAPPALHEGKIDFDAYEKSASVLAAKFPQARHIGFTLRETISADSNLWGGMLYDCKAKKAFFAPLGREGNYAPYAMRDIVDRFGGGDAFTAGLLHALYSEKYSSPETAVRFAAAAGALTQSVFSDYNYISAAEVETLMTSDGSGRIRR